MTVSECVEVVIIISAIVWMFFLCLIICGRNKLCMCLIRQRPLGKGEPPEGIEMQDF